MKPIDIGKIKIPPFEFESIIEINIEKELNEHSMLYVCGIVKDDKQVSPVTDMKKGTNVKCENDGQIYFDGILQRVKITCMEEVYRLEAYAVSNTILLDKEKKKRSFQDNEQTYQNIIETVIKDNSCTVTYNASEMKVENIILQYNETDWEFSKRLASHMQEVLIPVTDSSPAFHVGLPDKGSAKIESGNYSVSKSFTLSMEEGAMVYAVVTDEFVCDLGEKLNLNGKDLHVCSISLSLKNSALTVDYKLSNKDEVKVLKFYNTAVTGLILDGTVLKVENDDVKLHLAVDDEQDEGKAHLFAYAAGYSAEGHTGWYVMPEEGDTVQLLFPDEDEKNAYAISSVRQEDTEKTADPLIKYWRTTFGKEIKMDEKEILITSKDDETYIRINEETGIEIITPHPVLVQSGSTINVESEDDMMFITEKNMILQAKESIEMICEGNIMKFDPSNGITVSTDKKFELVSEDNATIDGKKEVGVKSGKDLKLDGGGKLIGAAKSGMELSSGGSSVKLASSGVDIKGTMIKEN